MVEEPVGPARLLQEERCPVRTERPPAAWALTGAELRDLGEQELVPTGTTTALYRGDGHGYLPSLPVACNVTARLLIA
jgi:hypothetical protein